MSRVYIFFFHSSKARSLFHRVPLSPSFANECQLQFRMGMLTPAHSPSIDTSVFFLVSSSKFIIRKTGVSIRILFSFSDNKQYLMVLLKRNQETEEYRGKELPLLLLFCRRLIYSEN